MVTIKRCLEEDEEEDEEEDMEQLDEENIANKKPRIDSEDP